VPRRFLKPSNSLLPAGVPPLRSGERPPHHAFETAPVILRSLPMMQFAVPAGTAGPIKGRYGPSIGRRTRQIRRGHPNRRRKTMTKKPHLVIAIATVLALSVNAASAVTHRNVMKPGGGDPTSLVNRSSSSGSSNSGGSGNLGGAVGGTHIPGNNGTIIHCPGGKCSVEIN
jgi:hypothetical protein